MLLVVCGTFPTPPCLVKRAFRGLVTHRYELNSKGARDSAGATTTKQVQHNVYWDLKETVWNVNGDKAFLFTAPRAQRSAFTVAPKKK